MQNASDRFPIFYSRCHWKPYVGWSGRHLLVIDIVQHFLVELLPRDAVPPTYAVRKSRKFTKKDAHMPTILQIQVAQTFGSLSRGQESKQLPPHFIRVPRRYGVVKCCSVHDGL